MDEDFLEDEYPQVLEFDSQAESKNSSQYRISHQDKMSSYTHFSSTSKDMSA